LRQTYLFKQRLRHRALKLAKRSLWRLATIRQIQKQEIFINH